MTDVILRTKLNAPIIWRDFVSRQRLIKVLNEGLRSKLILVTAPAGYGKSTLLSEWTYQNNLPAAWLTLDEGDNDLNRFIAYITAALQTIHEGIGSIALEGLRSSPTPDLKSIISQLINEIDLVSDPFVLILDDYQVIEFQLIQDAVSFLVEHTPPQMHVVISSRIDPSLPLARMRGRGQLTELREADLRFTAHEATEFFSQTMNIKLEEVDMDALTSLTEGWIAGLQLAAISIKNSVDRSAFITEFSGSHEFIVDYLTDEVLDKTPAELKEFLLQTSILKEFSAELCDQVTGLQNGARCLEELRENHLFLMPLDNERHWFRYHSLFADLLQKRLLEEQADEIPFLHQRASNWFVQNEDLERAIYHALQAEDYEGALSIIEQTAEDTMGRSEFTIFLNWLHAIPAKMTRTRPRLLIFGATASLFSEGEPETVSAMLDDAVEADEGNDYVGEISAIRAIIATLKGDIEESIERSQNAVADLPEGNIFLRSLVIGNLSLAYISTGDIVSAAELFSKVAKSAEKAGNHMAAVMALRRLAEMALISGDLHRAWDICKRGLAIAVYPSGKPLPVAGVLLAVQGDIMREWNQLPEALELIRKGIELILSWSELAAVEIYLYLARIKRSMGDAEQAQAAINTARQISARNEASRIAPVIVNLFQARLWLQLGQLAEVEKWEKEYQPFTTYLEEQGYNPKYHHHLLEIEGITFARLRLAQGRWAEALNILEPLHQAAVNLKRRGRVIEILVLKAIASFKLLENEKAQDLLEGALSFAEPQGYLRMFIDEGEPLRELLTSLFEDVRRREESDSAGVSVEYLNQLLTALTTDSVARKIAGQGEMEPFSDRELEVLRYLTTSLTSTEIAQELYISPNTVRFHIKNIYSKLGVNQRAAAVERARDLGLV